MSDAGVRTEDAHSGRRRSRAEMVYETLRRDILEARLAPGTALREENLCIRLGASRTPVRQALQRLVLEGLVHRPEGGSAYVSEISLRAVIELFQTREALEGMVARLSASSSHREMLRPLRSELASMGEKLQEANVDSDVVSAYYELNTRMDQTVSELADNSRLTTMLAEVHAHCGRLRQRARSNSKRLHTSSQEHLRILDAVIAGDSDEAEHAARQHVRASLRHLLASAADDGL